MKACGNFDQVEASQGGGSWKLEGGYACHIAAVTDNTAGSNPYLELVLNVLDPKTKKLMYPQSEMSGPEAWRHTFKYFIGQFGNPGQIDWGRFKALTEAVEQTAQNKGFKYVDRDGGEQQLVGKWVGVVFRTYGYTPAQGKNAGTYKEGTELGGVTTAAKALDGDYPAKWAEPRNTQAQQQTAPVPAQPAVQAPPAPEPAVDLADEDIPF